MLGVTCAQEVGSVPGDLRKNKEIKRIKVRRGEGEGEGVAWDDFNMNVGLSTAFSPRKNPRPCDAWKEETKVQRKFPPPPQFSLGQPRASSREQNIWAPLRKETPNRTRVSTDHWCCCCCCCFHKPKQNGGGGRDEKQPLRATRHRRERPCSSSNSMGT